MAVKLTYHPNLYLGDSINAEKLDKIKRSQKDKQLKLIREGLSVLPGTVIIPFSSVSKQGRDEIWSYVEEEVLGV